MSKRGPILEGIKDRGLYTEMAVPLNHTTYGSVGIGNLLLNIVPLNT